MIPKLLLFHPAVFAVEKTYQLLLVTEVPLYASVIIDGHEYASHVNGVRCSDTPTHRITIPQEVLDAAGGYTLRLCRATERPPYLPLIGEPQDYRYDFHPVTKATDIRLYQISDAHGNRQAAADAANIAGKPDLLIFNGDLPHHCGDYREIHTMLAVASDVAGGEYPCVCARGNHDLRGAYAEHLIDYMPHRHGLFYYTFRVGCIWGVVLDCGEDKPDQHEEYGGAICCHALREAETDFLRTVTGYDEPDVRYRLVICHTPFTYTPREPFNIEIPLYTEWATLLRERVKPHLMLCGHLHKNAVFREGEVTDNKGQPCPVIVSCRPGAVGCENAPDGFTGAAITLTEAEARITCNDNHGAVALQEAVALQHL